jgi:hypothetical protein
MTGIDVATLGEDDSPALADLMHLLIDRLDASLAGSATASPEVQALRRALHGKHRPQDEAALTGRVHGGRICLIRAPHHRHAPVRSELAATSGLVVDGWEDHLVALVPGHPRDAASGARSPVTRAFARVRRVAPDAALGVSTAIEHLDEAPRALDEASRALAACDAGAALFADDAWFAIAISRLRDSIRDSLAVDGPLDRLDDPTRSGPDLRATLTTWLGHDGGVRGAAADLHLHPNSLRYRLQRAAELTGLDLSDPLQRLVAHLALTAGDQGGARLADRP